MSVSSIIRNSKIVYPLIPIQQGNNINFQITNDGQIQINATGGGGGGGTLNDVLQNGNDAEGQAILNLSEINTIGPLEIISTGDLTTTSTAGNVITSSMGNITTTTNNVNNLHGGTLNVSSTGASNYTGDSINITSQKNTNIESVNKSINLYADNENINLTSVNSTFTNTGNVVFNTTGNTNVTTTGYSLSSGADITMTGVGPGIDITLTSNLANVNLNAGNLLDLESNTNFTLNAGNNGTVSTANDLDVTAGDVLTLFGITINTNSDSNNATTCGGNYTNNTTGNVDMIGGTRFYASGGGSSTMVLNNSTGISLNTLSTLPSSLQSGTMTLRTIGTGGNGLITVESNNNMLIKTTNATTGEGNITFDSYRLNCKNNNVQSYPAGSGADQGYIRLYRDGSTTDYGIPYFKVSDNWRVPTTALIWPTGSDPSSAGNYSKYLYNNAGTLQWQTAGGGGGTAFDTAAIVALGCSWFWDFTDYTKYTGLVAGNPCPLNSFTNVTDISGNNRTFVAYQFVYTLRLMNGASTRMLKFGTNSSYIRLDKSLIPQPANSNWIIFFAGYKWYGTNTSGNSPNWLGMEGGNYLLRYYSGDTINSWNFRMNATGVLGTNGATLLNGTTPNLTNVGSGYYVICLQNNSTTNKTQLYVNGILSGESATGANYPNPLTVDITIGNLSYVDAGGFVNNCLSYGSTPEETGYMSHMGCLTGTNANNTNRQKIEGFLMRDITGGTLYLPPDHPYKSVAPTA